MASQIARRLRPVLLLRQCRNYRQIRKIVISNGSQFRQPMKRHNVIFTQRRNFIPPHVWRLLWPIIQPILRPLIGVAIAFVTSFFTSWNNERRVAAARKFIESESGAAAATNGTATKPMSKLLSRSILAVFLLSFFYGTRLSNPIYGLIVGPEEVSLQFAEDRAKLPLMYYWNSKTAMQTMGSRLRAMETSISKGLANNPSKEKSLRADRIRGVGYSNGILVNLSRASYFASEGNVDKMEGCVSTIEIYQTKGGEVDEMKLNRIVNLGVNSRVTSLFAKAQESATKGSVSNMSTCISEVRILQTKLRGAESTITEPEIEKVTLRGHTSHVNNLLEEAKAIQASGSPRLTESKLNQARLYAKANNVEFPTATANEIGNR